MSLAKEILELSVQALQEVSDFINLWCNVILPGFCKKR